MEISTLFKRCIIAFILFTLISVSSYGQRNYATSETIASSGICSCGVDAEANAADGNLQTYSTLKVTLGVAAKTSQDLIFPGTVTKNTPVTVKLGTDSHLVDLTLLGGVSLQAYKGGTAVGAAVTSSAFASILSSNNQAEVTFTPPSDYDRVRVTLNGGLVGLAGSILVYDAFYNGPAPAACDAAIDEIHGISSSLIGSVATIGGVVNPHNAIDGDITTASTLNAGVGLLGASAQQTIIFQSASTVGDSVRLTISVPPAFLSASVISNVSITTFNGNTSNNDTRVVNPSLLSVRLLDVVGGMQQVAVTYAPTQVFDRVQLTLGGVASVLSTLNLYEAEKLIPSPVIKYNAVVTNNVQLCSGSTATLVANTVPNTSFKWYTQQTGGAAVATGASYTTPALTANTTYYVAAVRGGCTDESARTAVNITVNAIPAAPVIANNNVAVCQGQPATFAAPSISGVTVNWYTTATGGTPVFTGNNFNTGALTQTTTYYAESVAGGTCVSTTRTAVTATVSTAPDNPTLSNASVTICDGDVGILSVASPVSGITYNWYSSSTGGTILHTGTDFTTPILHANTSYYVEAINSTGCSSAQRAQGSVIVQPKPADPTLLANNATIAAGQTVTINVTNAQTGITYNWYSSSTASTPVFTGTSYLTPALYTTTTYYVSAVNSTGCQSVNRTAVTVNVTTIAPPCSFAYQQTPAVGGGICLLCGVSNNALAIDADTTTASTLTVTGGLLGAYAEQQLVFQNPGFAGDTVKIGLQSPVGLADVGVLGAIQVTIYNGATVVDTYTLDNSLIKIRALGSTGKYIVYAPATGAYDRVTVRLTAGVATLLTSLQVYYAVQQFPKPVLNPASYEICKGSTATLNITAPTNGTFAWFTTPSGGSAINTTTILTTGTLLTNTTYYIEYTRNGCVSPVRYPVQILVDDPPASPTAALSNVTINSGQTATLSAAAPNNATVKWYADPTGGTALGTGNTFTTPVLTGNATYYAESSSGSCVSASRTPVTVTVTPVVIPDVTVTPPTQAVGLGNTATLTASSTTPGAVFNWYANPTGGSSLFTGATFTTPSVFANTTYYAEASVPSTGAVSATRAPGAVTISSSASNPVPCDAAIDQTTATSAVLCLLCNVNNPTGSVDADRNTFSQLSIPVGLLNAYAEQTLRFATTARLGDSVVVELGIPGSLASVGLLSSISLATYNGTTYNNDRFNIDGSLLNVTLLNGTSRFRVAFKATADFDRVEVRLNSTASVLNALNIYDASEEVAAPTVTAPNVTVCQGSQATLTATAPNYVTIKWYSSATGGSALFTGAVFNTPVLNANTTYYAEASRTADGCTQLVRTPVNVTVTPAPPTPVVAVPTVTVCSGSPATFAAQSTSGITYNWYTALVGGTAIHTGDTFTTGALTATTSYYVEASNGQCTNSTRTQVTANVTTAVSDPTVAQVQTCSGSSAVLTATSAQPGVIFNWYSAATGGTPIFTGAQFTTPALTANTSYYVEATTGTCVSTNRVEADVVVNPTPVAPVLATPSGSQISSGQTAQITATSTTPGVVFNWYTTSTGGTAIFTGASFTTPALSSNTTYYVEAALSATGCVSSSRTSVTITVEPIFSTNCDFATTQTNEISNTLLCVGCAVNGPLNSVDGNLNNVTQLSLPVSVGGVYVDQKLIFTEAGAVGDTVSIKIGLPVSLLTVGVLDQIQIGSYNGVTDNGDRINVSNNLIHLQILSGGQTAIIKFAPTAAFDRVEVRLNSQLLSLLNSVDIYYASKQVEAPQLAASTVNICAGTTATFTVSNARTGVTYNWYDAPTGGHLVAPNTATFTTPVLTATTTYYVESSRTVNSCPNPNRVAAIANVTPAPQPPVLAQSAIQICAGDNAILSVTNANGATVNWYDAATGGNLVFTGPSFQISPVANIVYYAELSNGSCNSSTRTAATITVNPTPSKPGVASANVEVCIGSPAVLSVLQPEANVTYDWFTTQTGGSSIHTGTTFTTDPIMANTTYYIQATAAGGCINNGGRTQVNVNTNGQVDNPVLSANTTQICSGGNVSISVVNPVNGFIYKWYTSATGGTAVFTGTTYTINNLTANATYYVEADNSNGCTSATRTETDINVQAIPAQPVIAAASGLSICTGSATSISIDNPQPDQVYRWYTDPTGGVLIFTGTQYNTPALTATTTYYVEAAAAGNCNPSVRTAVTVTVNQVPPDPTVTDNLLSVCSGSPATLSISAPQTGISYKWYDSPARTNLLSTGTTYITGPITGTTNFYVAASNASGCQSMNLAQVQVTVRPAPSAPVVANGVTISTCSGSPTTLSITNPQAGYTYNWYITAAGTASVYTGTDYVTPALTANTTYYVDATNGFGCTSATRTMVNVTINAGPAAPQVTAANTLVCPNTAAVLSVNNTDATITIKWYTTSAGGTAVATGNNFTTPAITANTTYYAEATNASGCASATRTAANVQITQPLNAPVVTVGTTTTSSIIFQWAAITGATGYQVSIDNGATFTDAGNNLSYKVSGLKFDQSVTILVRATGVTACELSANSTAVTGIARNPLDDGIFVPNAFTPNGDGKNDIVYVYGTNIKALKFWVYDQWGEMQFQSTSQSSGWDGTYKGKAQPVGVYVYYLEATMNDGQIIKKKGTITLLR